MNVELLLIGLILAGAATILYAYCGFPLIAALMGTAQAPPRASDDRAGEQRDVTVIISAYNEEDSLDTKIRNVLATDHPREQLDVLVVSDASTDRTNEI